MKKIHKRIVCIFITLVILFISCVTPFFTSSAIAVTTGLAIAGLSALIGSLAAGIANGSAQELTGQLVNDITNAAELVSDNWGTGVNSIATDFNNFVSDFFDSYTIDGISVNGSDVARYVDYDSGTATINFDDYENLRKQFAGSLYKPSSDLVDDYLSLGGLPVLFRGNSFTLTSPESSVLLSKYSDRLNKGKLSFVILANVSGSWCLVNFVSGRSFAVCASVSDTDVFYMNTGYPSSLYVSATYNFSGSSMSTYGTKLTGEIGNSYSYDCTFYRIGDLSVVSGSPSDVVAVILDSSCTWTYDMTTLNKYITRTIAADTAIAGTVETPSTDVKKNDIENTVINGQGVGVVSENPTLTFVPTDTATGAADVAIDGKTITDVETEIADEIAKTDFEVPDVDLWTEKFPFSIPFDLYRVVSLFVCEPVEPIFSIPIKTKITNGYLNYEIDEEIILDMTIFKVNGVDVIRLITSFVTIVGFVVMLIKLTPRLFV